MGIINISADMLLAARARGASFKRVATLGRQMWFVSQRGMRHLEGKYGLDDSLSSSSLEAENKTEMFFRNHLGTRELKSIDVSSYQNANVKWNLNIPVPRAFHHSYDAVIDGGTLEHIFNFPTALAGCMNMVRPGGRLFIFTQANNNCGHGFYQFSPELFYRALGKTNGFQIERAVLAEHPYPAIELTDLKQVIEMQDPEILGHRVNIVNGKPLAMFFEAKKTGKQAAFRDFPAQSDYVGAWKGRKKAVGPEDQAPRLFSFLKAVLPSPIFNRLLGTLQIRTASLRNRKIFKVQKL